MVMVQNVSTHRTMHSMTLTVVPQLTPIDDTWRFYEPAESHFMIKLPQVIQAKLTNSPGFHVVVSNPDCKAEVLDKSNAVVLTGKTGEVMSVEQMTIYYYADRTKYDLLSAVRVEVHSREVIYTRVKMGRDSAHTLSLATNTSRQVRICPNKTIIFGKSGSETLQKWTKNTLPGSTTYFNVLLRVDNRRQLNGPTVINCVDTATDELVHSWLFIIEALDYADEPEKAMPLSSTDFHPRYI